MIAFRLIQYCDSSSATGLIITPSRNSTGILCCSIFFSCYDDRRKKKLALHSPVDMADKGRRQQPGFACEECRRRKARCDRARPTCGLCLESSTICIILDRKPQRGPKKGRINAMRSQIGLCPPYTHLHIHTSIHTRTASQPSLYYHTHTQTNACLCGIANHPDMTQRHCNGS